MQATDRTIYVGNVGKDVDESTLRALFGHCGMVTQIRIAGDPSYDTRYSFIEFSAPQEAETALLLDGMNVFDRVIKVNMARGGAGPGVVRSNDPDRVQRTVHVGGLPFEEITEETLADYFSHVGEVNAVRKSGRFAWVEFATLKASREALSLDGESLGQGTMKVSQSKTPIHTAGWRAQKYRGTDQQPLIMPQQQQQPQPGGMPIRGGPPPPSPPHFQPPPPSGYGAAPGPGSMFPPPPGPAPPQYSQPPPRGGYGAGPPPYPPPQAMPPPSGPYSQGFNGPPPPPYSGPPPRGPPPPQWGPPPGQGYY